MFLDRKKAFTITELMIVFLLIGVLSAILIPALLNASPDHHKLKAKKAYNTITRAVEYLLNSGVYSHSDGNFVSTTFGLDDADDINQFFCNNLAETLNVKESDCTQDTINTLVGQKPSNKCSGKDYSFATDNDKRKGICIQSTSSNTRLDMATFQSDIDTICTATTKDTTPNFKTADGVLWYVQNTDFSYNKNVVVSGITSPSFYNVVCFTTDDKLKDEYKFGLAIRRDGKMIVGTKLQTLLDEDNMNPSAQ